MRMFQVQLDEGTAAELDAIAAKLNLTSDAFAAKALHDLFQTRKRIRELETKHIEGYERFPVQPGEFDLITFRS
ncbi:MAG: CopG family transcriptional regulator [Burkholderiales bacterium]|nr:CopG family transcriptional regulator [Phycisphaerae bacterium]